MIVTTPDQALEHLTGLSKKLANKRAEIEKAERYYEGEHNLRFATRKYREAFGALFREFSDNYCGLVVDVAVERMNIEGFRFPLPEDLPSIESESEKEGPAATASQKTEAATSPADKDAWEIWQRNQLDLYSDIAHEQAFIAGESFLIVGPEEENGVMHPLITVEHPLEVAVSMVPGSTRKRRAAIKQWWDEETGYFYATLYLPDSVWKFQSSKKSKSGSASGIKWEERYGVPTVIENPFEGIVPVVPLVNRQRLRGGGRSELKDVIPLQDVINKTYNDALVASEFAAFRQRILTGMEVPEDENGNIIPDFDLKASVQRIMLIKDKDVGIHEFEVGDLGQYVTLLVHTRNEIAVVTRTPPQYLVGQIINVSGDALKAGESGLVSKVKRRSKFFGEGWEEAMRLSFLLKKDPRAMSFEAETIWSNPEITTESAMADSLAKYATLGVPAQALWERLGASQTEIARWEEMLKENPLILAPQALAAMVNASGKLGE